MSSKPPTQVARQLSATPGVSSAVEKKASTTKQSGAGKNDGSGACAPCRPKGPLRFPPRHILLNKRTEQLVYNREQKYVNNSVRTTKYTLLSFLPKNLFEQFRRVANFYFLVTACIQFIPNVSPLNPITSFFPLVFVLAVTAVKEAVEDYRRYRSDVELNARLVTVIEDGVEKVIKWSEVEVGDLVKIRQDEFFCADMVLLSADNPGGMAYVETSNLDGETNLKIRQAHPDTQQLFVDAAACGRVKGHVDCEGPTLNLYNFEGTFVFDSGRQIPLGKDQILLRGCVLKQTPVAYGIVVYTGHQTKLFLNSGMAPSKRTSLEKHLNRSILLMMAFQLVVVGISAGGAGIWHQLLGSPAVSWYLASSATSGATGGFSILTFLILYNVMIPISLYVSMEIVKLAQVLFLGQDLKMYYEYNDTPAAARTSNLNEELGQIEYVFSDKTGTLTCNVMEFMKCTIAGIAYGRGVTEIEAVQHQRAGRNIHPTKSKIRGYNFDDPTLLGNLNGGHPTAGAIREFLTMLAVNHAVIPETNPRTGKVEYQAASPDENALVTAAKHLGFEFLRRTPRTVTIRVGQTEETYEVLNLLEFSSKRKRSSVIVRTPTGELKLWCKGADSVIKERLDPARNDPQFISTTDAHLEMFATQGLRTLCFAGTVLDPVAYEQWNTVYQRATCSLVNREKEVEDAADLIEQNLVLIGATAIEDKLQDGVPDAIRLLEDANIKVWMLTGDKQETAINIGYACNLIDNSFTQIKINATDAQTTRDILSRKVQEFKGVSLESAKLGLIIDGYTLGYVLDKELEEEDMRMGRPTLSAMLVELAQKCLGVICCRMSPKQKASVVALVKKSRRPAPVTLSIGDGANDVPMIQTAHVGVGISGEEGLQAVRAADFAIAQFRFLTQLLLVHGRWSYKRIAKLVLYSFYKNMTFSMTLFWFNIFCGFSGQTLYDSWYISLFNVIFTGVPIIGLAIFDQDVKQELVVKHPKLYLDGQRHTEFSQVIYWLWILRGLFHSLVCFFVPALTFGLLATPYQANDILPDGTNLGVFSLGMCCFWAVVCVVTCEVALEHNYWTWISAVLVASAPVMLFAFSLVYTLILSVAVDVYYVPYVVFRSGSFWFAILLSVGIAMLPDFALKAIKRNYFPSAWHIVQETTKYGSPGRDIELSRMGSRVGGPEIVKYTGYGFESPRGEDFDISREPQPDAVVTHNPMSAAGRRAAAAASPGAAGAGVGHALSVTVPAADLASLSSTVRRPSPVIVPTLPRQHSIQSIELK